MTGNKFTYLLSILCAILVTSFVISDVNAKPYKSSSHSYPSSHGSSGTHHTSSVSHSSHSSYPSSHSGLSGSGSHGSITKHTYPSSSHGYPSSNSHSGSSGSPVHTYPTSHGTSSIGSSKPSYPTSNPHSLSGSGTSGSHSYPSSSGGSTVHTYPTSFGTSNKHTYPSSNSNSLSGSGSRGSHSYPSSNGLSGGTSSGTRYPSTHTSNTHTSTNVHFGTSSVSQPKVHHTHHTSSHSVVHHHHYDYRPPTVIHYSSSFGMNPVSYPVYSGTLPPYVYEYRSSGSRYSNLLSGLALYNLGKMSSSPTMYQYHSHYVPQSDEYCKFGVRYATGNFDEMKIDCRAITSLIFEAQSQPQMQNIPQMQTQVTKIINQTTVTTNMAQNQAILQGMLNSNIAALGNMTNQLNAQVIAANGTIVPSSQQVLSSNGVVVPNTQQVLTGSGVVVPNTQQVLSGNGMVISNPQVNTVTTTTTQVVTVTDPKLAGQPVEVNQNMECYVTRTTRFSNMKKSVPCGLLQTYATQSLHRNAGMMTKSSLAVVMVLLSFVLF